MKKTIILLSMIILMVSAFSQDTSIVNYYPMKVGNVWKYRFSYDDQCGQNCHENIKMKIVDSVQLYGKKYFIFQTTIDSLSGNQGRCISPGNNTMRVDSVTGNLLKYSNTGNCYLPHDIVLDSLRSRLHDTLRTCGYPIEACLDTSNLSIFGISRPSKTFSTSILLESALSKVYVKGIGYRGNTDMGYCNGYYMWIWNSSLTLAGCVINGLVYGDTSTILGVSTISSEIPKSFSLSQNYPNPFNPSTNIKFELPKSEDVKLIVYDMLGNEVATLVYESLQPGSYEVTFDGSNLASGIYLYKLKAGNYVETRKMILLK